MIIKVTTKPKVRILHSDWKYYVQRWGFEFYQYIGISYTGWLTIKISKRKRFLRGSEITYAEFETFDEALAFMERWVKETTVIEYVYENTD